MTTLTDNSSSELSGPNWARIVALYGIGPLVAVFLIIWLTKSLDAKLDAGLASQQATQAAVIAHAGETHDDQKIQRALLYAICLNISKTMRERALCEVGQ